MDEKGAHSALMRGVLDPFANTVLVARQRRVKLTLELSFLRRASRWSAPSAKRRRRVAGAPIGTIRTYRYAAFATSDRYVTRVDSTRQYFISLSRHILTQYPWCSFSQLDASKGKCFGCGKDGANTSLMLRSKLKKDAWYCQLCIMREVHISRFFILSLSLCPGNFVGMITSVTSCFVSTHVVRVPYFSQKLPSKPPRGRRA